MNEGKYILYEDGTVQVFDWRELHEKSNTIAIIILEIALIVHIVFSH